MLEFKIVDPDYECYKCHKTLKGHELSLIIISSNQYHLCKECKDRVIKFIEKESKRKENKND